MHGHYPSHSHTSTRHVGSIKVCVFCERSCYGGCAHSAQNAHIRRRGFERTTWSRLDEIKNLLMPLFLMGCFPVDFQEVKRPLRTKSVKRPIKVGKRPINEGKRPIKAKVLVGVSVGCLMGCFRAPPPWRKTAPLKRPIKRSMMKAKISIWAMTRIMTTWTFGGSLRCHSGSRAGCENLPDLVGLTCLCSS